MSSESPPRGGLTTTGTEIPAPPASVAVHHRVVIVGSGFSGIGAAIRLRQAGVTDFVVLERADDLGGTWRDNHYPGCCCDVPSHLYSFSFDLNPLWTRAFAPQWEIQDYLRSTAEKHGVLPHIRYRHEMTRASWDDAASRWLVETTGGSFTADVLVLGTGALSEPLIPDVPGRDGFAGRSFHSADWDHGHVLRGRRVAVIGTGASAIQFVPHVQREAARVALFQRTPPWILPRWDHRITEMEHRLLTRIPHLPRIVRGAIYAGLEMRVPGFTHPRLMRSVARVARWHLHRQVADPAMRRALTPDYVIGCKRILISDDYYPAVAQPNVELVTAGVREIRPHAVVDSDGVEHEVDTIIWGTGFRVTDFPIARQVLGRNRVSLRDHWRDGPTAYLGLTIPGFPNLFLMTGPNSGLGHTSMVYMIESQLNYVLDCIRQLDENRIAAVDVRPDVERRFNDDVQRAMEGTVWTAAHCRSWYLDASGRNRSLWPGWTFRYRQLTRRFRLEDYRATPRPGAPVPTATPLPPAG